MFFKFLKRHFTSDSNIINNKKSIYKKKVEEPIITQVFDILEYGYPESRYLRSAADEMINIMNINKHRGFIESLKMTAAHHNLFSLSSPQVKSNLNIFCMHKDLSEYKWINDDKNRKLSSSDYEAYINPRIMSASKINHFEYEECGSFKILQAKAKRPLAVVVSFFDENGKPQERELFDFEARVFSHEYDHLMGIPFIHWRVSEGDIRFKEFNSEEESWDNLFCTLEYYRNRLRDAKMATPTVFDYFDVHMINRDIDSHFDDQMQIDYEFRNKKSLSFDDVMLIDLEKGIRKDLKLTLKKMTKKDASKNVKNTEDFKI